MDYFKVAKDHIQGDMDIDVITNQDSSARLISLGADDLVSWKNLTNNDTVNIQLAEGHGFTKIALHPRGNKFLLAGPCKKVVQYQVFEKKPIQTVYEALGNILDVKYSPLGRFVAVAGDQQKVMVIDTQTNRKAKCRPGHSSKVYNIFFISQDKYIASIGEDLLVLIYELSTQKDPQQVFRTKFTNQPLPKGIKGSYSQIKGGFRVFIPGTTNLQIVEQLTSRWEIKKTNISHNQPILVSQAVNDQLLVTSCSRNLCLWSIQKQQKLIWLPDISMSKILPTPDSFVGCMNDGNIYFYNRPLRLQQTQDHNEEEESIIQQNQQSKIQFQNNKPREQIQLMFEGEAGQQGDEDYQQQIVIKKPKKRTADNIIKVYPQEQLTRSTTFFDEARFLYVNAYGLIIETRQMDQTSISVQFAQGQNNYSQPKNLFRNRQFKYFDIKGNIVAYANQNQYGVKIDNFSSWEKQWVDIQGIAFSGEWMAVANLSEIRFIDITGNLIKQVCFDRLIVTIQAYENLLVVVYHESIPIYQSQLLAMKIFTVNRFQSLPISECHVPLTMSEINERGSTLRWFGFSSQGMIFSQDSFGVVRAYSLQYNQWTPIVLQNLQDPRKAWVIGFTKNEVRYWKTTQSQPEPTVRPRLPIKKSNLTLPTLHENVDDLQNLPHMLFHRYLLDHQMARWRLWGRHKQSRQGRKQKHINYQQTADILDQKQIYDGHLALDLKFYNIIKYFLKNQQATRAVSCVKSYVRLIQTGKNLINYFDDCGHRSEAVDLQYFYDQKQKQMQYEAMQQLALKQLKSKVETTVKAKKQNPMNPKFKKQIKDSIPYHISSQPSQNSSIVMEDITHKAQQVVKQDEQVQNPFLKKKPIPDRKQQIEQHLEKYAVKKKAEDKKKTGRL